jgi:hypothetical protein
MGKREKVVPEAVKEVKVEVERWRAGRQGWARMPEELWEAAAAAARKHGVAVVAREVRLDYMRLKKRVRAGGGEPASPSPDLGRRSERREGGPGGFVEVEAGDLAEVLGGGGAEVEVWEAGGERLKVKVPGREGLDVAAVVRAFRGGGP